MTSSPVTGLDSSPPTPASSPPPSSRRRLPALDVLRGIAILGTLLTNIWIFAAASSDLDIDDQGGDIPASAGGTGPDNWVTASSDLIQNALNLVTDGKFIGLLTIMFGIGLEIQRQSAIRRGEKWPGRYPWRAGLLILDGLLNYIFIFEFDVLMGYGLTGLVVAAVLATSPRAQKIWMAIGITAHLAFILFLDIGFNAIGRAMEDVAKPSPDDFSRLGDRGDAGDFGGRAAEAVGGVSAPIGTQGYWEQVASRVDNFIGGRGEIPIMFLMGLGLFLVGAHLYRAGLFEERGARLRKWTMILSLGIGLPIDWTLRLTDNDFGGLTRYVTSSLVAFGVLALVAGFYVRRTRRIDAGELPADRATGPIGHALSLVGRMALTCYIGQNLIASIIFYDWGFGASAKISGQWYTYWTLVIYLGIAALLVGFSALWLRCFPRGPVELVWHSSYEGICRALDRRKARKAAKTGKADAADENEKAPAAESGTAGATA
ncbi:DUF418 domain-containing protein [uncultured Corynebacterium sp.]|uniref:DUF418 domain-containing protein n=1 Tax=uncultured Corynebacterium sp. TaxID=159447 RepID=UPI0025F2BCE6|nr:DUF418 domain-containing protein [uncultured Corynebacterium sp.]